MGLDDAVRKPHERLAGELTAAQNLATTEEIYLQVVRGKTAALFSAATEVGGAVVTAVATTVISFLPVFTMEAAEGKLFRPLAYTKTFALIASLVVAITLLPPFAHLLLGARLRPRRLVQGAMVLAGIALAIRWSVLATGGGVPAWSSCCIAPA